MSNTVSKGATVLTACTKYKNIHASYSESNTDWRLSKLDGIVASWTSPGKKSVYAKFTDTKSKEPICEGELKSCVPIVKDYFNQLEEEGACTPGYALESSSCSEEGKSDPWFTLHAKMGDFEFTCA